MIFSMVKIAIYFMHSLTFQDNPSILMRDISEVNDPSVIAKNPKVTAINSCIEVDLT